MPRRVNTRRATRATTAVLVAVALTLAGTSCVPVYDATVLVSGLHRPWDIGFAGGVMFVTEKTGRISAGLYGQSRTLAVPADVRVSSEGGMMGLAVDPGFYANRRIYTCFLSNASGALDVRLVRWTVSDTFDSMTSRTDILTGIPVATSTPGRHSGCRPRFGPDGYLWVTTGDSLNPTAPQDPTSLAGKVLRITTDGAGAPGNPGGTWRPEVYSIGHRNPQGITFDPRNGAAYSVEHGTGCDDEVNFLVPGGNYGWNPNAGGRYDEDAPMTDFARVPGAIGAVWRSGCPTIAPSGATFISGSQWTTWENRLAMAVLKDQQLRVLTLSANGLGYESQDVTLTDRGRLRVVVQGPDGNLFIATDADPGVILRVAPR